MLSFISKIGGLFSKGSTRVLSSADLANLLAGGGASSSGISVNETNAIQVAAVYSCVKVLSESLAQLPLDLSKIEHGVSSKVTDDSLYDLLHFQPNKWQTSFEFREMAMYHLCLRGNFYAFKVYGGGAVRELLPLDGATVTQDDDWGLTYEATIGSKQVVIPAENIFHIRGMSIDGVTGISPIQHQRETLGLAIAGQRYGASTFKNGARPGGVLTHPGKLSREAVNLIRETWETAHGAGNTGGTAVVFDDMKYTPITMTNADVQYIQTRELSRNDICSIFRVPPHLIADLSKATFSNIEHQSLEFAKYTLLPWIKRWEQAIRRDILTQKQREAGYYVDFNLTALERADIETRYKAYMTGIQNGILSPNEVRAIEGLNPREGGDIYITPMNMTTDPDAGVKGEASNEQETVNAV